MKRYGQWIPPGRNTDMRIPLCLWRDFEQHRSGKIKRDCEFGYIRHQVYQSYGMFPARHMVAQKLEQQELTKALEEKIPALAQEHGGKLNAILKGSDAAFKQTDLTKLKDVFLVLRPIRRPSQGIYDQAVRAGADYEKEQGG